MIPLEVWIWGIGPTTDRLMKEEIGTFKQEHSDIDVNVVLLPWREVWGRIVRAANEQAGPDIVQIGSTWNATLAHLGVLEDLTAQIHESTLTEGAFMPAAWSSCHFPGSESISSLPWVVDIRALYYRQDIFKKFSIDPRNLDTWQSFAKTCRDFKSLLEEDESIGVLGVSGQQDAILLHNVAPWIWGAGGDFISPDGKQAVFNSKEAVEGLEFYASLMENGYIPGEALKLNTEDINNMFFSRGKYVMSIPGPFNAYNLRDPRDSFYTSDFAEHCIPEIFPRGPRGRFVFCGGSNLAVTSFSKHPSEAWEFVSFMVSSESQEVRIPGLLDSLGGFFTQHNNAWKNLKDAWKYGKAFPNIASWAAIEALLIECFGKIFARFQGGNYSSAMIKNELDYAAYDAENLLKR
ncbi:MAG: extracellular solute-binding protein [bacterium]